MTQRIDLMKKVLGENDRIASGNRQELRPRGITTLNLVSAPGSGKTSLLERTIAELGAELRLGLIAGDVQTENDARRLDRAGPAAVRPLVTGGSCHLDAAMIRGVLPSLELDQIDLLLIENVGNLVCPSSYDLGEDRKVVLVSTAEGDDKPLKYPAMFRQAEALVINKIDLLGTSDFSMRVMRGNALQINGNLEVFEVSCRSGNGLDEWYTWLRNMVSKRQREVA